MNPGITTTTYSQNDARAYCEKYHYTAPQPIKLLSGQGVLAPWTVMAKQTSTGKYLPYNDAGTDDGRRVAVGILGERVDTGNGANPPMGHMYIDGPFFTSRLVGYDANAGTDMNAVALKNGATIFKVGTAI